MQIDRQRHNEVPENTIALMIWQRKVASEHVTWGQPSHAAASVKSNFLCDGDAKVFDIIWQGRVLEQAAGDDGIENTSQSPFGSGEFKLSSIVLANETNVWLKPRFWFDIESPAGAAESNALSFAYVVRFWGVNWEHCCAKTFSVLTTTASELSCWRRDSLRKEQGAAATIPSGSLAFENKRITSRLQVRHAKRAVKQNPIVKIYLLRNIAKSKGDSPVLLSRECGLARCWNKTTLKKRIK